MVAVVFMLSAGDVFAGKDELKKMMKAQRVKCYNKFNKASKKKCSPIQKKKGMEAWYKCLDKERKVLDNCLNPEALEINAKAEIAGKLLAKREKAQDKCLKESMACGKKCMKKKDDKKFKKCSKKCSKNVNTCLTKIDKKYKKKIDKLK